MATFGELLSVADGHLDQAISALDRPDIAEQAGHPGTVAELARLTAVLARYGDSIADRFGLPSSGEDTAREAAQRFRNDIHQARLLLGDPPWSGPHGPDLARTLRAVSDRLGCGLDLLDSHFPRTSGLQPGASSANAMVIAASDVALLHKLSRYTAAAGRLALHSTPEARGAADPLIRASDPGLPAVQNEIQPVDAMPVRHIENRIPPAQGEDVPQLMKGIDVSARRLQNMDPKEGAATWRYLATAAAIIFHIGNRTAGLLAYRLREIDERAPDKSFLIAAHYIRMAGRRWRTIQRDWKDLTGQHGDPRAIPAAVDASDLLIRLGRLTYADPAWTPASHRTMNVVPPNELVPNPECAGRIGLAVLKSVEACNVMAAAHRTAVNDVARITLLRQGVAMSDRRGRPPAQVRQFITKYEGALLHGKAAAAHLGNALLELSPNDLSIAAQAALIVQRAGAPNSHESPASLAAQSFPDLTTQALQQLAGQEHSSPPIVPTQRKATNRIS